MRQSPAALPQSGVYLPALFRPKEIRAYKDCEAVAEAVELAGIGRMVARFKTVASLQA